MQELASGPLDPTGGEIQFSDIVIRSPGVSGEVLVSKPVADESRSRSLDSDALGRALDSQEVDIDYVIEVGGVSERPTDSAVRSRSMAPEHKGIEIQVPAAGEDWGQVLLVTDENGIASWHFPLDEAGGVGVTRGGTTVLFVIPGYVVEAEPESGSRGILGWLGKKVVRVLSFALEGVIGKVGEHFARKWENANRPYAVRRITKDTYRENGKGILTAGDWKGLAGGRSLLFLHGTFSRAASAFYELTPEFIDELNKRYSNRVFAFDHPTLSQDPTDNARYFVEQMPPGQVLDVDIVCHSRGGHVSRVLVEEQEELPLSGKSLTVGQVVFVASPNRGTVLTDAGRMGDFVDSYTNILGALPDNVVTDVLEVVLTVVKQIAVGVLKGLEGLQSMNPSGPYLEQFLNRGTAGGARYRGIAANFEPTKPELKPWAKDKLMDLIFKEENDLVVPTRGVCEANGDPMFPIESGNTLELTATDGVHHGNYFGNSKVVDRLGSWLTG